MRLFAWLCRDRLDDLADEIQAHIDEKTDELVASGVSRADAELAARRALGNVTNVQERARDVWRFATFIDTLAGDARLALRRLMRKPGYATAVILTLALGIGANAVVFALVSAVVLKPLPYPNADRIISVVGTGGEGRHGPVTDFTFAEWAATKEAADKVAAYEEIRVPLALSDGAVRVEQGDCTQEQRDRHERRRVVHAHLVHQGRVVAAGAAREPRRSRTGPSRGVTVMNPFAWFRRRRY